VFIAFRVLAVFFALATYMSNFEEPESLRNTVGCGLVALTFAVLSLGRPSNPGRWRRLDNRVFGTRKQSRTDM
jgi:hypothetical protein